MLTKEKLKLMEDFDEYLNGATLTKRMQLLVEGKKKMELLTRSNRISINTQGYSGKESEDIEICGMYLVYGTLIVNKGHMGEEVELGVKLEEEKVGEQIVSLTIEMDSGYRKGLMGVALELDKLLKTYKGLNYKGVTDLVVIGELTKVLNGATYSIANEEKVMALKDSIENLDIGYSMEESKYLYLTIQKIYLGLYLVAGIIGKELVDTYEEIGGKTLKNTEITYAMGLYTSKKQGNVKVLEGLTSVVKL